MKRNGFFKSAIVKRASAAAAAIVLAVAMLFAGPVTGLATAFAAEKAAAPSAGAFAAETVISGVDGKTLSGTDAAISDDTNVVPVSVGDVSETVTAPEEGAGEIAPMFAGDNSANAGNVNAGNTDDANASDPGADLPELVEGTYEEGEVLAYVSKGAGKANVTALLAGAEELMEIDGCSIVLVKSRTMSTEALMKELSEDPRVISVEPNYYTEGPADASTDGADKTDANASTGAADDTNPAGGKSAVDASDTTTAGTEGNAATNPAGAKDNSADDTALAGSDSQVDKATTPAGAKDNAADDTNPAGGKSAVDASDTTTAGTDGNAATNPAGAKDDSTDSTTSASEDPADADSTPIPDTTPETEAADPVAPAMSGETGSTFGPDKYTGDIPDMTRWQWGNKNNGSMAGTYISNTAPDIRYSEWNTTLSEELPEYVIGVLDTGVDENNPDLADVLWTGEAFDDGGDSHGFYSGSDGGTSTTGLTGNHGTHVAGIIAAQWNGLGTSGVAPNVKIMSLRYEETFASAIKCMNYAKLAAESGVKLIAVNNSWGMGYCTSSLVNAAVTALGEAGVVSVFAAGNDSADTDRIISTSALIANNPYAIVVDAIDPDGDLAAYSNYGIGTTEVSAPGSLILSTNINDDENLQFMGEVNAYAAEGTEARDNLVSYTSFGTDYSVNGLHFTILENSSGQYIGSDLKNPDNKPDEGAFDGERVLSLKTTTDGLAGIKSDRENLSGLSVKPRYVSFRVKAADPDQTAEPSEVEVPVIMTGADGPVSALKKITAAAQFGGQPGTYAGVYADLSLAETLTDEELEAGYTSSTINWQSFTLTLYAYCMKDGDYTQGTLLFDSVALGSVRYPFIYMDGTSMACPGATGVLAVIAGKYAASLGTTGTPAFAEKLAAMVKAAGEKSSKYSDRCGTSAYVTVDGAAIPGPAIVSVTDDTDTFTITGYFMPESNTSVTLDGLTCTASGTDLGNDKYELTVNKPAGYQGGKPVITVTGSYSKKDSALVELSPASGAQARNMYDNANVGVPTGLLEWTNYDLTGFAGKIYAIPRSATVALGSSCGSTVYTFSPEDQTWKELTLPVEALTINDKPVMKTVVDMTAALKDGKLNLLLTGLEEDGATYVSMLMTLDEYGNAEAIASAPAFIEIPALGTLASDGTNLYLVGGIMTVQDTNKAINKIYSLTAEDGKLDLEAKAAMPSDRITPRVSYSDGVLLVSGGNGASGFESPTASGGVEWIPLGDDDAVIIKTDSLVSGKNLTFASGVLKDGSFLLTGPTDKDRTTDTYTLASDKTLGIFTKQAYTGNLLAPASVAYNGQFYVLATVTPSGENACPKVFSYTAVDAVSPMGDGLIEPIKATTPVVEEGVDYFEHTDFSVSTQDFYNSLGNEAAKMIYAINNSGTAAHAWLRAAKLERKELKEDARSRINQALKELGGNAAEYYDISLYVDVPGQTAPVQLHTMSLGTNITLDISDLPAAASGATREFTVIAYHEEAPEAEKVEIFNEENGKLTVVDKDSLMLNNAGRFSVYAICYKDVVPAPTPTPAPTPSPTPAPTPTVKPTESSVKPANTGDNADTTTWIILMAAAIMLAAGGVIIGSKSKSRDNKQK